VALAVIVVLPRRRGIAAAVVGVAPVGLARRAGGGPDRKAADQADHAGGHGVAAVPLAVPAAVVMAIVVAAVIAVVAAVAGVGGDGDDRRQGECQGGGQGGEFADHVMLPLEPSARLPEPKLNQE